MFKVDSDEPLLKTGEFNFNKLFVLHEKFWNTNQIYRKNPGFLLESMCISEAFLLNDLIKQIFKKQPRLEI